MKICYVTIDLALSELTGGTTHTLELSEALSKQSNSIYIISRRKKGETEKGLFHELENYRIYRFGFISSPSDASKSPENNNFKVNKFLKSIYHLYLRTLYAFYAGIQIARVVKKNNIEIMR